jgi:hypothetical protein
MVVSAQAARNHVFQRAGGDSEPVVATSLAEKNDRSAAKPALSGIEWRRALPDAGGIADIDEGTGVALRNAPHGAERSVAVAAQHWCDREAARRRASKVGADQWRGDVGRGGANLRLCRRRQAVQATSIRQLVPVTTSSFKRAS